MKFTKIIITILIELVFKKEWIKMILVIMQILCCLFITKFQIQSTFNSTVQMLVKNLKDKIENKVKPLI